MDFNSLITILEKELTLYKSLYSLAVEKTEIVKKGDVKALNQLMTDEQKHVTAITALEQQRMAEVKKLFPQLAEQPTITECIEQAHGTQQQKLQMIFKNLVDVLEKTKEQNKLNHELVTNSLQFVNFSLNLIQPKQLKNYNYGPDVGKRPASTSSLFDSEA